VIELSVYYGDTKITKIYRVDDCVRFMVLCHDKQTNFLKTEFFYTEQQAEDFAEEWIDE
jgi:hypothetical protein